MIVQQAEHLCKLPNHRPAAAGKASGRISLRRRVDRAHQLKEHADGVRRVEVIIHGLVKPGAVAVKGTYKSLLVFRQLTLRAVLRQKIQIFHGVVQALQRCLRLGEGLSGVVERRTVVGRQHEKPDWLVPVGGGGIPHGKEIPFRL
ncbi:hypothetical protein SDC9_179356 [bioreactor metagenome]|uniref:Uncharacterized protein n=1 Tax=bioreactor metagenome TaxID=1076179 RepID=A0A645GYF1_9ZZZZ